MVPTLPNDDPAPVARAAALEAARAAYPFSNDVYPGLAMAGAHPKTDASPPGWSAVLDGALKVVLENDLRADRDRGFTFGALSSRAKALWAIAGELVHADLRTAVNDLVGLLLGGDIAGKATAVDDFRAFFRTIPVPAVADSLDDDMAFARRYLAGANPESLERLTALDADFPVTQAHLGENLEQALAEGRLYTVDYRMLDGLPPNTLRATPIVVVPARAMLVRPRDSAVPRLFAIQLATRTGPDAPIFTPQDGVGWRIAKTHLAVADTICGAIWFHHARTHLVAEPLIVAAHRSLAPNHPLMVFVAAHAAGTLSINEVGAHSVFASHGLLDWFTGTSREGVRELSRRSVHTFDFAASNFPARLAARGVDDPALAFPFRDDGLLVWEALRSWVCDYVGIYYASEEAVAKDHELAAWMLAASANDGGGIRGLGGPPATRQALVDLLTQFVFAGSALHAAMNFPVADELTFVPNSPFGAWAPPPTRTDGWTQADYLAVLPPLDAAQRQFDTALLLGMSRVGHLGDYPPETFVDARVRPALDRFVAALATVEATIRHRNQEREPYVHLLPSRIPPSINI